MKKPIPIVVSITVLILIAVGGLAFWLTPRDFHLNAQFYGNDTVTEIDVTELETLIDQKSSFLLFAYQSSCSTSDDFAAVLKDFAQEYSISLLEISFTALKQSQLVEGLKYYPSAVIYRDGQVVNFLDADSNTDLPAYQTVDGFVHWLSENRVLLD